MFRILGEKRRKQQSLRALNREITRLTDRNVALHEKHSLLQQKYDDSVKLYEDRIADLEIELRIERSNNRVQSEEINKLAGVCARDLERVKAEQAVLGFQHPPLKAAEPQEAVERFEQWDGR